MKKECYIISGPNGAGKTTFAKEFLPMEVKCYNFINADLIAMGLSPFKPEIVRVKAGKLMIKRIDECIKNNKTFAFETTFSGKTYIKKIKKMKTKGYKIIIYFLKLASVELAIARIKLRVAQGGHDVPINEIKRRFHRSWQNFQNIYKPMADKWVIFDTSGERPIILEESR